jgi:predicted site-specific integrase-resolvase
VSGVCRVGEFAERIGRSASTVRRIDLPQAVRRRIVYCRVSSPGQKDDLASQVAAMEQFCLARGTVVDEWVTVVGGGMNLRRRTFLAVMDAIERDEVAELIVAHKDRLARFGFDYLEHVARRHGCVITVANAESLSPEREMVEDLLDIVHTFSCRLYGLRRYEKTLKNELGGKA